MFAKPRPKKDLLVAPSKKRKATHAVEEISFDTDARSEYLTGFHKRKLQRVKNAQEQAAKREREEKVQFRRQMREERRREVEQHVSAVNALLKEADRPGGVDEKASEDSSDEQGDGADDEEWIGLPDAPTALAPIDHEEEYIDEDKYTSVTVESVSVGRDGLYKPEEEQQREEEAARKADEARQAAQAKVERPKKKKKKPTFRYENKADRAWSTQKEKARHRRKGRS